jgi:hypothetical protein
VVTVTAKVLSGLLATQPLLATTPMFPLVALQLEKSTIMEDVPCPETMTLLAGTVQI